MIEVSESQKKVIGVGLSVASAVVVLAVVAALVWGAFMMLSFLSAALIPVITGFFLSLFFKPYYNWCKGVVKNPTAALVILLLTVLVPFALLLWYAGAVLTTEVANLISQAPQLAKEVTAWFQSTFPNFHGLLARFGINYESFGDVYLKYGTSALVAGTGVFKCLFGVVSLLVTMIFFVNFLMTRERKGSDIVSHLPFLKEDTRSFIASQIDAFADILVSFFQRQVVICLLEGLMYGIGFWVVGLPYGMLIGFALGVLNLIPFFGSLICLPIALPLAYFTHGGTLTRLVMVLVVWGVGQLLDGYFITPKIQGNKTGLGYAGVIFSFFFWSTVLGPLLGMLLAIPLSAFCVVLWRALTARYIRPVV